MRRGPPGSQVLRRGRGEAFEGRNLRCHWRLDEGARVDIGREVALRDMAGRDLNPRRNRGRADLLREEATGPEATSTREVDRTWKFPLDRHRRIFVCGVRHGHGGEQRAGVRVGRMRDDLFRGSFLDDPAEEAPTEEVIANPTHPDTRADRKSTRLNSRPLGSSYAVLSFHNK